MIEKGRRICIANADYDEGSLTPIVPLQGFLSMNLYVLKPIRKGQQLKQQLKQQNNLRGIVVPVYLYFLDPSY